MRFRYKQIFFSMLLLSLSLPVYLIFWLQTHSYQELHDYLKPDYFKFPEDGEGADYGTKFFHPGRFKYIRPASWMLLVLWLSAVIFLIKNTAWIKQIKEQILFILTLYKKQWLALSSYQKKLSYAVLSACIISKFVFLIITPENTDGIWSFEAFVKQGFWVTITYYPDTNNHVFFNLLCLPFSFLFPHNSLLTMTLPNILLALLIMVGVFSELLRRYGFTVAILAITLAGSYYESSKYFTQGRGHLLTALFALIATFCLLPAGFGSIKSLRFLLFVTVGILGMFTVPSFVLHLFPLYIFMTLQMLYRVAFQEVIYLFFAGVCTVAGTLLCYTPAMLVSGTENLFHYHVAYEAIRFLEIYPVFLAELIESLMGVHLLFHRAYLLFIPVVVIFLFPLTQAALPSASKLWLKLLIFIFVAIAVFPLFSSIFPPYRAFGFFSWYVSIGIAFLIVFYFPAVNHSFPLLTVWLIVLFVTGTFFWIKGETARAKNKQHNGIYSFCFSE
jgi:hypothetical protein